MVLSPPLPLLTTTSMLDITATTATATTSICYLLSRVLPAPSPLARVSRDHQPRCGWPDGGKRKGRRGKGERGGGGEDVPVRHPPHPPIQPRPHAGSLPSCGHAKGCSTQAGSRTGRDVMYMRVSECACRSGTCAGWQGRLCASQRARRRMRRRKRGGGGGERKGEEKRPGRAMGKKACLAAFPTAYGDRQTYMPICLSVCLPSLPLLRAPFATGPTRPSPPLPPSPPFPEPSKCSQRLTTSPSLSPLPSPPRLPLPLPFEHNTHARKK
ncbi:hypothetical protein GGS23DRAFT_270544 [Durotheca rogersii]|uniref:uncharacterized protein n=1 Tax=Durotheca rogersii TaxID=419775 RepID=UPI00221FD993|nr:uncharacterized protein GGS23DRAFT_270544 [Durotheca rogersii]KAI5866425.1 hypothetical protein GGS23DRAFT_270544 [Durotheca rogersii]